MTGLLFRRRSYPLPIRAFGFFYLFWTVLSVESVLDPRTLAGQEFWNDAGSDDGSLQSKEEEVRIKLQTELKQRREREQKLLRKVEEQFAVASSALGGGRRRLTEAEDGPQRGVPLLGRVRTRSDGVGGEENGEPFNDQPKMRLALASMKSPKGAATVVRMGSPPTGSPGERVAQPQVPDKRAGTAQAVQEGKTPTLDEEVEDELSAGGGTIAMPPSPAGAQRSDSTSALGAPGPKKTFPNPRALAVRNEAVHCWRGYRSTSAWAMGWK